MEQQVANILLGQAGSADSFILKFGLFRFRLKIKPLTVRQLIRISGEVSQIRNVDTKKNVFVALMEGVPDIRYIAKIISIATGTRFMWIVKRAVMRLPLNDVHTLFKIVRKQSDPTPFFFIISMTGRMNIMKKKRG